MFPGLTPFALFFRPAGAGGWLVTRDDALRFILSPRWGGFVKGGRREKTGLEFEDDGVAGGDAEFFGGVAFGDGDFELPIAVDQGEGSVVGCLGVGAEEGDGDRLALDGEIEKQAGFELAQFGSGEVGDDVAVVVIFA